MMFRLPAIIAGLFVAALTLGGAVFLHPSDVAASLAPLSVKVALTGTPPPPRCPGERFTDVCPGDYFYRHVLDLNDLGILSGYSTVPPCDGPAHIPCFKPYNWTTRGQVAKVVSMAAGFNEPVSDQTFEDVPPGSTFYEYIERLSSRTIVGGYPCGDPNLPCGPGNKPYFLPGNTVSRGQLTKMVAIAFGFDEAVSGQTFQDVPPGSTFHEYIERLANRGIISGYRCGGPGEMCVPPSDRPYFRPANPISRGQVAKIVNLARIDATPTPAASNTPSGTPTSTQTTSPTQTTTALATSTGTSTHTPTSTGTPTDIGTPTATPTCCPPITGSISASCQPSPYTVTYTITNSCAVTQTATFASYFEVSPNASGPWHMEYIIECFKCPILPGTMGETLTVYSYPLPAGNRYWRYTRAYGGTYCRWDLILRTDPMLGCELNTVTPSPTPSVPTATPTATDTPTATPTCCTDVTGSISASCQPTPYEVTYTTTNNCTIALIANIASIFEVSPNASGPWQTLYVGDCFSCPVPPGTTQHTETVFSGPLPAGNNYWRYRRGYYGTSCNWSLSLTTDPQPACTVGTATSTAQIR
ncbi:MAG: S-layer homology domain-containing protein [Chloroflexota bacterium]